MTLELVGWVALVASGLVIVGSAFAGGGSAPAATQAGQTPEGSRLPLMHVWLEIAWPTFFVAAMGMLMLKDVMTFPAILLLATTLTGIVWAVDAALFSRKRGTTRVPPLVEMAKSFFPVILVIFLLRSFLYEPFRIPSESMLPTLEVGDFILVNKFAYGVRLPVVHTTVMESGKPQRGDVMVFRLPEDPAKDLIKRVIGVPGDTISYRDKRLTVNGKPATTEILGEATTMNSQQGPMRVQPYRETLGDGAGARTHAGLVNPGVPPLNLAAVRRFAHQEQCRYVTDGFTCTVPPGHYFMMGDNRDNSDDSRYWGFVPDANIVGKAVAIWMNLGNPKRIGSKIE